jgi:hypothetical protein
LALFFFWVVVPSISTCCSIPLCALLLQVHVLPHSICCCCCCFFGVTPFLQILPTFFFPCVGCNLQASSASFNYSLSQLIFSSFHFGQFFVI